MMLEKEHIQTMDCSDIAELLPTYLNRSLEEEAARRVEAHLAACPACRQEEHDTRTAMDLYEGHLPVDLLLDYALEQPTTARARAAVESHLAECERCSAEVATVRQEHTVAEPVFPSPPASARASRGHLRTLAWAASLAAIVAAGGWISTWRQLVDERTISSGQIARANLAVVELLPTAQPLLRYDAINARATANRLERPDGNRELVLVLLSGGHSCKSGCSLEIYEAGKAQSMWRVEGLVARPNGHLTVTIPGHWLAPKHSVLAVRDQGSGELVAEYLVEIQPSANGPR